MYDMLVDPLNAPKDISPQNIKRLMKIYQQVHRCDLDTLGLILEKIEQLNIEQIKQMLSDRIATTKSDFCDFEEDIKKIYAEEDFVFDGNYNKYLT